MGFREKGRRAGGGGKTGEDRSQHGLAKPGVDRHRVGALAVSCVVQKEILLKIPKNYKKLEERKKHTQDKKTGVGGKRVH